MTKSSEIIKRVAVSVCVFLVLVITARMIDFLMGPTISPAIAEIWQFLRGQSRWVLLIEMVFVCAVVYILITGDVNLSIAARKSGFAYCYGHRQDGEVYYEKGTLTFLDEQLTFVPYSKGSRSFTIPYIRIVKTTTECDRPNLISDFFTELYRISVKYKDSTDMVHVLDFALPHFTEMMPELKQKLYNLKDDTNS